MDAKVSGPNKTRRRVIQGSLAAPVVLTVSSASAQSVSSFGRCLTNLNTQPSKFFLGFDQLSTDTWLRKEITVEQLKKGNDIDWFYNDPGLKKYVRLSNPSIDPVSTFDVGLDRPYKPIAKESRWALVWVDSETGVAYKGPTTIVVQVQKPDLGYQFTTKSCYTSLIKI